MAQTKRKRRTKHRGNAAGIVEQRGRTSRPLTPEERKAERRAHSRRAKPPSWQRAATRSGVTTLLFVAFVIIALDRPIATTVALGAFVFLLYIPFGYYADLFFWRRLGDGRDAAGRGRSKPRG